MNTVFLSHAERQIREAHAATFTQNERDQIANMHGFVCNFLRRSGIFIAPISDKTRAPGESIGVMNGPIMDEDDTHRDLRQLCQEQTKRIEEMQRQLEPCEADRASWAKINKMLCEAMPGYKGPPAPDDWCRCALMELLDQRRALCAALTNSLPTLQVAAPPAYLDAKQALADVNKTLRES